MPFKLIQPSALGSAWDYDVIWENPWPGWNGTQTWEQLFVDLDAETGYSGEVVNRIGNTYFVFAKLRFVEIDMLVPLLDSTIICRNGGLLGFHADSDIQFGSVMNVGGVETGINGCTIIEDTGSGSRESDNFNKNTRIVMNSTLKMYDTTFRRRNTTRSDFDWNADSLIVMRDVILQMRGNHFNHFYGKMDIVGLEVQTTTGSSIEFRTAEEDFINFDNVFPYRLDGNEEQRVLVLFVPPDPDNFTNIYTFRGYKGLNFARWSLGSGRSATFIDPYYAELQSVGGSSGRSGHAFEKRTLDIGLVDDFGNALEDARIQIQHRIDGFEIPEGWLMDDQFPYDVNLLTNEEGRISSYLRRRYWRHNSAHGGTQSHEYHDLTPHIMRIYKYGYLPVEQPINATPIGNGAGGFSLNYSMFEDENITLTKSDALNLQNQISVNFHGSPVTWQDLEWDVTFTTDLTAKQFYQWARAAQDEGIQLDDDFLPNFMPSPDRVIRGYHNREYLSFRVINSSNEALPGIEEMVSKNGDSYVPPVQVTFTLEGLIPDSEVRIFKQEDDTELIGVENSSQSLTYSYIYTGEVVEVYYVVFHLDYLPIKIRDIELGSSNQNIRIRQIRDRWSSYE